MKHIPRKRFGQHFLSDHGIIDAIVQAIAPQPGEPMVEIGPGLAALTQPLVERLGRLTVIELDRDLALRLRLHGQLDVIESDVLKVDFSALAARLGAGKLRVVGNLPYNISVPVLLHFMNQFPSIRKGLVMVQAEVAHRLAAAPNSKEYGVPSLKMAWYGPARLAGNIGRNIFWPVPGVDSALVYFQRTIERDPALQQPTFTAIDQAFLQRRKTLRQALAGWAGSAAAAEEILVRAGVDPQARGEQLNIDQFIAIASAK